MTDLHTQYQTLLRRGMPEHPRLSWEADTSGLGTVPSHYWHWRFVEQSWSIMASAVSYGVGIDEQDARDLVTMHALRWFRALDTTRVLFDGSERMVKHAMGIIARHANVEGGYIPDTLDAILAATEHLEPK